MPLSTSVQELARIIILTKVIKLMLNALNLLVNVSVRSDQSFSKIQEEQAYTIFIEDFSKFVMRNKAIHLLKVISTMMHSGFISRKTCEAMTKSF